MSGTPGIGLNNPEGFQNFVTPAQMPTIAVDTTVGDVAIPLSVFPFWRNDGGFRSFGGAKRISIFDAAVLEGVSTPDIPAITDQPIESQGTFTVSNPDAQKLYKIIVRLRSASGDPNFRDFICEFRLVTPLEVPLNYTVWDDADIPTITYNGVDFFWSFDAPLTEIRLRDGVGSILVGNLALPPFNPAAKAYLLRKLQSERDGILFVDFFAASGLSQSTRRQVYHYSFDGVVWTFDKIRDRDFPSFDQYSGSDFGVAQANIDLPGSTAEISFIYNTYTYGQRFEEVIVVGRKGFLQLDPKLVLAGQSQDISSIVDFSIQAYWHKFNVTDQYITLIGITDSQVVYRQIPLWPTASHLIRIDAADYVPPSIAPVPAEMLQARLLFWPFIHFPNLETVFLTVPPGLVGANPAGLIYPDLLTINLYDGNNPIPVATYVDEVDLWNNLVAVRCPDQGLLFGCLDVRTLLTPTSPFFRIEAGVRTALSAPGIAYTFMAHYTLNVNGEPVLYTRDDFIPPLVVPVFNFDEWGRLSITWPATIVSITGPTVQFAGDVGTTVVAAPGAFPTTVTYDLRSDVMSREASYVDVEFEAFDTGGFTRTYTFRVPTLVNHQQLLGPTDINIYFAGNVILFPTGSTAAIDPLFPVVIVGDVGQISFYDPQENVPYFTGQLGDGGERVFSNPLVPNAIVMFTDSIGNPCQVLIPNTFYDLREGADESFVVASRAGGPVAGGLPSSAHNFTLPKGRISLSAATIEFEDDLSGFSWNFQQWQIANGASLRRKIFNNTIVVATPYNIADVLTNARLNDYVIVTFKHREGFQRIGAYKITGNFEPAKRLDLEGFA